jgi:GTP-binding protein Era
VQRYEVFCNSKQKMKNKMKKRKFLPIFTGNFYLSFMEYQAGFVNIIGSPNVGKSTLLNALMGQHVSIANAKAQTTRHRILGILTEEKYQIVFSDTPGLLKANYKLQEKMMQAALSALSDADVLLWVTDIYEKELPHLETLEKVKQSEMPVLVLINKIDQAEQEVLERIVEMWHEALPNAEILPISALHKANLELLHKRIVELLPEHPAYYEAEEISDRPTRFFITEIVREKILKLYEKEIPYCTEVIVEDYKEKENITHIKCVIYVVRESQRGIIIGHQGKKITELGTKARKDIENFLQKRVYLELFVKVKDNWRENEQNLKEFGYQ